MASFPTLDEYNGAIQSPASFFTDPELASGHVQRNAMGLPAVISGGFALTYTVKCASRTYAVRCFHKSASALEQRYKAISRRLHDLHSSYFVDFEFQKSGIKIQGIHYPVVKMAWAEGQTLGSFLRNAYNRPDLLGNLDTSLRNMAEYLEANNIAHGDIQPGNLIISDEGKKVQLIDYDGMYVDEIADLGGEELGLRNFQHPDRKRENWGPHLDRFSFALFHLVFSSLREFPDLWLATQSDADSFLLTANDFLDPGNSEILNKIAANSRLFPLVRAFSIICLGKFQDIPPFGNIIDQKMAFDASEVKAADNRKTGYLGNYPVVSALDYQGCLAKIGDMVELVGKVVDIKKGFTRFRKPYCFINFKDWHGEAVKIAIWGNTLKLSSMKFESLKGKYVSVIGLLEPPYVTKTYSHISLQVSESTIIKKITAREAAFRINSQNLNTEEQEKSKKNTASWKDMPGYEEEKVSKETEKMEATDNKEKTEISVSREKLNFQRMDTRVDNNDELISLLGQAYHKEKVIGKKPVCPVCHATVNIWGKTGDRFTCSNCKSSFLYDFQQNMFYSVIHQVPPVPNFVKNASAGNKNANASDLSISEIMAMMKSRMDEQVKKNSTKGAPLFAVLFIVTFFGFVMFAFAMR